MKTYIKSEILNKYFAKGLNEITENLENVISCNKIKKENLINMDSEYIQIKRINLICQDKRIILHNNIECLNMDLEKDIVDFSCRKRYINGTDFFQICENIKTINNMDVELLRYYYNNNEFYIINMYILPNEYHIKESNLFTINKIKHTFLPYMSKITQNLYNKIVFPIMKKRCHNMKYRKKSIEIEAIQLKDFTQSTIKNCLNFMGQNVNTDYIIASDRFDEYCLMLKYQGGLLIKTCKGRMLVSKGDYIIKETNGEFYPCKSNIFEETYEKIY